MKNTIKQMMTYLTSHYSLRYNAVKNCTEYCSTGSSSEYLPLDLRKTNSMAIEVRTNEIYDTMKRHIGSVLKISSLQGFGRRLSNMPEVKHRRFMSRTKYLVRQLQKQ